MSSGVSRGVSNPLVCGCRLGDSGGVLLQCDSETAVKGIQIKRI